MKRKGKVLHGWEHETTEAKVEWFLTLSPQQRYEMLVTWMDFLRAVRKDDINLDDWRSYQTVQVIKCP